MEAGAHSVILRPLKNPQQGKNQVKNPILPGAVVGETFERRSEKKNTIEPSNTFADWHRFK